MSADAKSVRHREFAAGFGDHEKAQARRQPLGHRQHAIGGADVDWLDAFVSQNGKGYHPAISEFDAVNHLEGTASYFTLAMPIGIDSNAAAKAAASTIKAKF